MRSVVEEDIEEVILINYFVTILKDQSVNVSL